MYIKGDFMKTLKKYLPVIMALMILVASISATAIAFAENIDYYFDEKTSALHITGNGKMDDFENEYSSPWRTYAQVAKKVVIEDGVTSVGANSFAGFNYLNDVQLADSVTSVGNSAFASCPNLKELTLSPNVTSIADTSFAFGKDDFKANVTAGSYALYYLVRNNVNFNCESIELADFKTKIANFAMHAYYPIKVNHNCTVTFESTGNFDTKCFIYDSSFKRLATDDNSGSNYNFKITYSFTAGDTYYFDALMWSTGDRGTYNVNVNVDSFDYSVSAYAMADPSGTASNIVMDELLLNGSEIGNGTTLHFDENPASVDVTFNGKTTKVFVTPTSDNKLVFVTCDVNNDGYVNAKDFAVLHKENSKYLPLYENFINYKL